jgi:Leucine-rich repeat (LRR) protein
MQSLVNLGLNENNIAELPPQIGKLTKLELLGMHHSILSFQSTLRNDLTLRNINEKMKIN